MSTYCARECVDLKVQISRGRGAIGPQLASTSLFISAPCGNSTLGSADTREGVMKFSIITGAFIYLSLFIVPFLTRTAAFDILIS
jgi:hypothetical protein